MTALSGAPGVVRSLGLVAAASIAISNMIGQGVFLKARAMTCNVGSPTLMLAAWVVAGLLALCGALTLAELGAAIPESGGLYAFLRRAYGGGVAFAYGWMGLFIGSPGSIAALAAGAAIFFNLFSGHALDRFDIATRIAGTPVTVSGTGLAAIAFIVVMTAVNCAPAVVNGRIATGFAALKLVMLAAVTVAAFALYGGSAMYFGDSGAGGTCAGVAAAVRGGVPGFAAALIGALYAFQGWQSLVLLAGEVKRPGRNIPLALIASVVVVIVLYVAANAAFVYVLGPTVIASLAPNQSVGVSVVERLFGLSWRVVAAVLLFLSVVATLHVTVLSNARITYALAADMGFTPLARVSSRGHVPVNAVLINSAFALVLVLIGSFDTISNYFTLNAWLFFVASGVAMFVLRRREPGLVRPYRTAGFPVVPAIYVGIGGWLVVQTALSNPQSSAIGIALLALSVPVYLWRRRQMRVRAPLAPPTP